MYMCMYRLLINDLLSIDNWLMKWSLSRPISDLRLFFFCSWLIYSCLLIFSVSFNGLKSQRIHQSLPNVLYIIYIYIYLSLYHHKITTNRFMYMYIYIYIYYIYMCSRSNPNVSWQISVHINMFIWTNYPEQFTT
jgi:phosphatidylserine synthase